MTGTPRADLILTRGRIYTVDAANSWAEAVAIADGRILAVGSAADIEAYRGDATEMVDLEGRMAMPGFVDIHNHIMMGGQADLFETQLPAGASVEAICAHVRAQAVSSPFSSRPVSALRMESTEAASWKAVTP